MIVTFVSQCEKKALARTRRVLDAFADRIRHTLFSNVHCHISSLEMTR